MEAGRLSQTAIEEYKAAGEGVHGLEDPGPNADLLQELGITIPRPPVRYIMSAAAEAAPKRDDVVRKKCCAASRTSSPMDNTSTDSGE